MTTMIDIKNEIKARVLSVSGVEICHIYQPYKKQYSGLIALYKDSNGILHGYYIMRTKTRGKPSSEKQDVITFSLVGYKAVSESNLSELVFETEIEAIRSAFDEDHTLNGLVDDISEVDGQAGVQVNDFGYVTFAGVFCHAVTMELKVAFTPDFVPATAPVDLLKVFSDIDMAPQDGVIDASDEVDLPQV